MGLTKRQFEEQYLNEEYSDEELDYVHSIWTTLPNDAIEKHQGTFPLSDDTLLQDSRRCSDDALKLLISNLKELSE